METGRPAHRLYACVMLASWGVPAGLRTLIGWAADPATVPWAGQPVTYDRHFGVDSAFEMLADAVRIAGESNGAAAVADLRAGAAAALLGLYDRVYFGRALMVAFDLDRVLAAALAPEVADAVDRTVAAARGPAAFDLATQAAFLLGPLAALDDAHAARAAEALLAGAGGRQRTVREVAHALGTGTGPDTRAILERLAGAPDAAVRQDARESLARR